MLVFEPEKSLVYNKRQYPFKLESILAHIQLFAFCLYHPKQQFILATVVDLCSPLSAKAGGVFLTCISFNTYAAYCHTVVFNSIDQDQAAQNVKSDLGCTMSN